MNKTTIGIIGSGIIASSMAVLTTGHGLTTKVFVRSDDAEERLRRTYADHFALLIKEGILTEEQYGICATYLHTVKTYRDMTDCGIFYEAVAEVAAVKASVFAQIAKDCPEAKLICSASSAITPDMMLEELKGDPCFDFVAERLVITHPFNPAHMVPYVEFCGSSYSSQKLLEEAVSFMKFLDREPVVLKKPTPGFIGNRLQFALFREAMQLVEEGVCDFEDIDRALKYSFCPRYTSIGIFEHMDYAGLDLDDKNCKLLFPIISDRKDTPPVISERLAAGKSGTAAGEGFYDWRGRDMEAYASRVNAPFWKFCHWDFPAEAE